MKKKTDFGVAIVSMIAAIALAYFYHTTHKHKKMPYTPPESFYKPKGEFQQTGD